MLEVPTYHISSKTSNYHTGVAIKLNVEQMDINSSGDISEDCREQFEICCMTRKDIKDDQFAAYFLTFIDKEAFKLLKDLASPEKPISLTHEPLKKSLLSHVQYAGLECGERAKSHKMV